MTAEASPTRQQPPRNGQPQTAAPAPLEPPAPRLVPFCFWLPCSSAVIPAGGSVDRGIQLRQPPDPVAVSDAISCHLAGLGWNGAEPLRWAITAVDPARGLQLEGVGICDAATASEDSD